MNRPLTTNEYIERVIEQFRLPNNDLTKKAIADAIRYGVENGIDEFKRLHLRGIFQKYSDLQMELTGQALPSMIVETFIETLTNKEDGEGN